MRSLVRRRAGCSLALALALSVGCAAGLPRVQAGEVSFELPGWDWGERAGEEPVSIHRGRLYGHRRIAIWPVDVPPALRGRDVSAQARGYFDAERRLPRLEGQWEGFEEGERAIAGRPHPVMTFRARQPQLTVHGLFLLYFPEDFAARQRFYVLMWMDHRREEDPPTPLDELDVVVSSLRVGPRPR